jgi:hypothetical protein
MRASIIVTVALALGVTLLLAGCGLSGAPRTSGTTAVTSTGGFPTTSITKASADLCNLLSFAEVTQATGKPAAAVQVNLVEVSNVVGCTYTTADNGDIAGVQWTVFDNGGDAEFAYDDLTRNLQGQANVTGYGDKAVIDSAGLPHLHVLKGNLLLYFNVSDFSVPNAASHVAIEEQLATLLLGKVK